VQDKKRMNKIKNMRLFLFSFFVVSIIFLMPAVVLAGCPPTGFVENAAGVCLPTDTGLSDSLVVDILKNLMLWLLGIVGVVAIIAFTISGIQYLVSTGDEGIIETAKRNMTYSIVGIIVALAGWIIITAIDNMLKGVANF